MSAYLRPIILTFTLFCQFCMAEGPIIVVANTQDKTITLSRHEVRNLFMGGALGHDFKAVALPLENHTRILFNTKVVGLTESRIQSYWAQMRFTGRKKAPQEVNNEQLMLEYLKNNAGAVGYLPAGISIPEELTVVYTAP